MAPGRVSLHISARERESDRWLVSNHYTSRYFPPNMAISDIKCPQPRRPFLKRKASQFASIDGTGKRPRFLSSSIDPIPSLSLRRSRSDTFLARNITPWLNYLDHFRPATAPITSFSSYSSRLDSPFDRSISMPSTDSGPAASPSYRDVLRRHGIYFQTYGDIPPHVKEFALGIIQGERTSPGLSDDQMSQFQRDQFDYSNSDESQTKAFLQAICISISPSTRVS